MALPQKVADLVDIYERNRDTYKSANYNETELRREFIDPLFAQLGWDVDNSAGYADAYKDVVHEDTLRSGGAISAPDYSFRIGGTRKFFLEAKRPAHKLKGSLSGAYQIRSYGWSAKLPLCILTNFEEFAIYDCRFEPHQSDNAAIARIDYFTYAELELKWPFLLSVFSKDAVLKGSFDKYAVDNKVKRGTLEVDQSFLERISGWRLDIARSIVRQNTDIDESDLDYAVQQTIDRIVFLRICEDRGIESYGRLRDAKTGAGVYERLKTLFRLADDRYNSGLFHFRRERHRTSEPDSFTLGLKIEDLPLRKLLSELYYPESPYQFSVIPADILGQVYEQWLGEQIRLTPTRIAKLDVKPDVRKAGGVFYTPTYVVDEIVKNVITPLLYSKGPADLANTTILDPACGSGSFLIKAYQFLLDWHLEAYTSKNPQRLASGQSPRLRQLGPGQYQLTIAERKRILLDHIYGVDLDPQAVEVTKLNLLLKVLEGESGETINQEVALLHSRALPDLDQNILCGNSLISPKFSDQKSTTRLKASSKEKVHPFDWATRFADQMNAGGFSAIIGNPPYIQLSMAAYFNSAVNEYLETNYSSSMGRLNTFGFFIERSLSLLKQGGTLGFIVPNTILTQGYYKELRAQLLKKTILAIINYRERVFQAAVVDTCSLIVSNSAPTGTHKVDIFWNDRKTATIQEHLVPQSVYENADKNAILVNADIRALAFRERLDRNGTPLGHLTNINQAIALKTDRAASLSTSSKGSSYKKVLDGRNIDRYSVAWSGVYLKYDLDAIHSCKRTDIFEAAEKLLFRRVGARLTVALDVNQYYALNTLVVITAKREATCNNLRYLLVLLNSRLLNYYYYVFLKSTKRAFSEIQARQLATLPIVTNAAADVVAEFTNDADRMIRLSDALRTANNPHKRETLVRELAAIDAALDRRIYRLYGLSDADIAIVEALPLDAG